MQEILITNNNQKFPRASYYTMEEGNIEAAAIHYDTPENILNENKVVAIKKLIPETYEELKEILLNKYKDDKRYVIEVGLHGDIYFDNVEAKRNSLTICKKGNGNIIIYDNEWPFAYDRTPEQALNIIENLMD